MKIEKVDSVDTATEVRMEDIEKQLIKKSEALALKLIESGEAPTSLILHYLKLATQRERIEQELLKTKLDMLKNSDNKTELQNILDKYGV